MRRFPAGILTRAWLCWGAIAAVLLAPVLVPVAHAAAHAVAGGHAHHHDGGAHDHAHEHDGDAGHPHEVPDAEVQPSLTVTAVRPGTSGGRTEHASDPAESSGVTLLFAPAPGMEPIRYVAPASAGPPYARAVPARAPPISLQSA